MQGFQQRNVEVVTQDGRNFTFLQPVVYIASDGTSYTIPRGATTDGASTPAELWPAIPPFGDYWLAAALHDASYRNTLQMSATGEPAALAKPSCDNLLKEAMESLGVSASMVETIYEGVVFGGWKAFDDCRKI